MNNNTDDSDSQIAQEHYLTTYARPAQQIPYHDPAYDRVNLETERCL